MTRGGDLAINEKPKHRQQKFCSEWLTNVNFRNWVERDSDEFKARCKLCNASMVAEKTVLKNHGNAKKHLSVLQNVTSKQKSMTTFTIKTPTFVKKTNKAVQEAEIKLAGYIAEHNIPFLASDHLTDLLKEIFPDSSMYYIFYNLFCKI